MPVTFKNTVEVQPYRPNWSKNNAPNKYNPSGLAKNRTYKNTKPGHSTIERQNYNAEKGRLNALKKKHWRTLFTEHWMKLYKDITESDERFHMGTDVSEAVLADLYSLLRSSAKGRAKAIADMPISNAEKEVVAEKSIKEFVERGSKLTYDMVLERITALAAAKAIKVEAAAATARAIATKPQNLNRLSGKKRRGNSLTPKNVIFKKSMKN
jgi:hypothetical protein